MAQQLEAQDDLPKMRSRLRELEGAEVLNRNLRKLIESKDAEIFRLRELIAKREKREATA